MESPKDRLICCWDTGQITENELAERKANWQEFYPDMCEDENGNPCCPSEETILADVYNSGIYDMEWDCLLDTLQGVLDEKNPDGYWKARVENFGWRNSGGQTSFCISNAKEILRKILPDCECTFYVYEDGPGLKIRNFHHDSPTGNEWYYLQPDEDYINYCDDCDNEWETEGIPDCCPECKSKGIVSEHYQDVVTCSPL